MSLSIIINGHDKSYGNFLKAHQGPVLTCMLMFLTESRLLPQEAGLSSEAQEGCAC